MLASSENQALLLTFSMSLKIPVILYGFHGRGGVTRSNTGAIRNGSLDRTVKNSYVAVKYDNNNPQLKVWGSERLPQRTCVSIPLVPTLKTNSLKFRLVRIYHKLHIIMTSAYTEKQQFGRLGCWKSTTKNVYFKTITVPRLRTNRRLD